MPDDIKPADSQEQSAQPVTPAPADKAQPTVQPVVDDLPDKFKGKSSSDIAKSYIELEKKLTTESTEKSTYRQQLEQFQALARIIESDPVAYSAVEAAAKKTQGVNRDTTVNVPASTQRDDTRATVQNMVINQFEQQYGIDKLPSDKRLEMHQRIGTELAEILDPTGTTPVNQLMQKIPSDKLGKFLEKAYKVATAGDVNEASRLQGMLEAQQNNEASFNSMPSNGISASTVKITPEEHRVAVKMKISDEDYIKNKLLDQSD